jgi:S-adenosylmethionine-diacylglycerol 3-amino-3-carboxypropyl transferase
LANALVRDAALQAAAASTRGILERVFARMFEGLVYAQIWEDPEVDLAALELGPTSRVVTIASGGCNAMSYLVADPARVQAVDLNPAHVALLKLKLAAARHLPQGGGTARPRGAVRPPRRLR